MLLVIIKILATIAVLVMAYDVICTNARMARLLFLEKSQQMWVFAVYVVGTLLAAILILLAIWWR